MNLKLKKIFKYKKAVLRAGIVAGLILTNIVLFSYLFFLGYYQGKFFPGVKIAGLATEGQIPSAVLGVLQTDFQSRVNTPINLTHDNQQFDLDLKSSSPSLDLESTVNKAYALGRSGNYLQDLQEQLQTVIVGKNFIPRLTYKNKSALTSQINQIKQLTQKLPQNARLTLGSDISVTASQTGEEMDLAAFNKQLDDYLKLLTPLPAGIPVKTSSPTFTTEDAQKATKVLEKVREKPLTLRYEKFSWNIDQTALFNLLDLNQLPKTKDNGESADEPGLLNKEKMKTFLSEVATSIDQPTSDAKFKFDPSTKKVSEFESAKNGQKLDQDKTTELIVQALTSGEKSNIDLPVSVTQPKITNSDVNSLGIDTLLGEGISNFRGSIENRIFNIGLAASRLDGALIPPGEIFSFNNTVGEISGSTGYKPAYVIKSGRTVLDDGGGVCQVSTTLFRAVLNAGLPIVARTAHAYRVSYYEQGFPPGLDATVFAPSVDFKFKNDTLNYVLIQANRVGTSLYIDIYGTDDGRITSLTTPKVLNQTPPPPELRQDDPTLPRGTVKQVDWPAWGANVEFGRTVTRKGETLISESWKSNYKPWQAVFLVGTKD